jgi:hypothetical protein
VAVSTAEIVLSNVKDVLGIAGTVLIALPFFRLERAKRHNTALGNPPTRNPILLGRFNTAKKDAKDVMDEPSGPDFLATLWGLLLVGLSFVISLVLPYLSS